MPFNKLSGDSPRPPTLPVGLQAGEYWMLPTGQGVLGTYGTASVPNTGFTGSTLTGQYLLSLGLYSVLQVYDSSMNYWRNVASGGPNANPMTVSADGYTFRVANTTGCPVGALLTAGGSGGVAGFYGYQQFGPSNLLQAVTIQNGLTTLGNTVFTITPSAGSSTWNAIVGGSVNTTISVSGTVYQNGAYGGTGPSSVASGGSNYTAPPLVFFFPPPNQGAQPYFLPSAYATLTSGAVSSITVLDQGAGLLGLPGVLIVPAPGDTTGGGAVVGWLSANSADPNAGKVTAMWPSYYGAPQTAAITFTYGGTNNPAPTATAIMNFTITSFGGSGGVGYGTTPGGAFNGGIVAGTSYMTNPANDKQLSVPIFPPINVATGTGVPTLAGPYQGSGIQAATVTYCAIPNGTAAPTTANTNTVVLGGAEDVIFVASI